MNPIQNPGGRARPGFRGVFRTDRLPSEEHEQLGSSPTIRLVASIKDPEQIRSHSNPNAAQKLPSLVALP